MTRRARKLLIVFVIVPLLLAGVGFGALVVQRHLERRGIESGYARGREAFQAGRYAEAMPLIAKYAGRNRQDAEAMLMLAKCRGLVPKADGREIAEAAAYAEQALAASPGNVEALELLVGYYAQLNFVTELGRACDRLLEVKPDHAQALSAKAQSLVALGKYDEAQDTAQRLMDAHASNPFPARLLLEIKRLRGATPDSLAKSGRELVERLPEDFGVRVLLAQMLSGNGDYAASVEELRRAAELTPAAATHVADLLRLSDALVGLARLAPVEQRPDVTTLPELSRSVIAKAIEQPGLGEIAAALGAAWEWRNGRSTQALEWIERGLTREGNDASPALLTLRAIVLQEQGQESWEQDAAKVRAASGNNAAGATASADAKTDTKSESKTGAKGETKTASAPPAASGRSGGAASWTPIADALVLMDQEKWKDAGDRLEQVRTQAEQEGRRVLVMSDHAEDARVASSQLALPIATFFLGVAEQGVGDWRVAVQRWAEVGQLQPTWTRPLMAAANVLIEHNQPRAALRQATRAFGVRPGVPESVTLARAITALEESEGPTPDTSALLKPILERMGETPSLEGEGALLRAHAAITRRDSAQLAVAMASLEKITPAPPSTSILRVADRLQRAGLPGADRLLAIVSLSGGSREAGSSIEVALFRARALASAGDHAGALKLLREAEQGQAAEITLPLRLEEAKTLAMSGASAEARAMLDAVSKQFAASPQVQQAILEIPVVWTDAPVVEGVIARLRAATGEQAVEWKLADAARQLTFDPDPAKAQEIVLRLSAIVREDPSNAQALSLLSEWMLRLEDPRAAIDYLSRAIETPDAPAALYPRVIDLLRREGRRDEARSRLDEFAGLTGLSDDLRRTRARLLSQFRLMAQARADLEYLAGGGVQGGGRAEDQINLADALLAEGEAARAGDLLEVALGQGTLTPEERSRALGLLSDAGRLDKALELADASGVADDGGPVQTLLERARLLERAGRLDEAEQALRQAVANQDLGPARTRAFVELARFQLRQSKHAQANATIAEAKQLGLKSAELDSVEALASAIKSPGSAEQQQAVIAALPQGPTRELAIAAQWFDANPSQPAEFVSRLRRIVASDPELVPAWQFLAQTLMSMGNADEAIVAARGAVAANPRSPKAAEVETRTLLAAGRGDEARAAGERWRQMAPDPTDATLVLVGLEIAQGRASEALVMLESLVPADSGEGQTRARGMPQDRWATIVAQFAQLGKVARARELAGWRDTNEGGWSEAMAFIAAHDAEPVDEGRAWLGSLVESKPTSREWGVRFAEAYAALASRSRSPEDFQRAFALVESVMSAPDASNHELVLGATLLEQLGRYDDAKAAYRRVIERDGTQWVAMNNLAFMLVKRDGAPSEALELAERASGLVERFGAGTIEPAVRANVLSTLALAQLRAGRGMDALRTIRTAVSLDRASGEAWIIEAEALEATGDAAGALEAAKRLIEQAKTGGVRLGNDEQKRASALIGRIEGE
ncbi:MAG: tetratricopeptide repeat protein [Planctomycetota bacterium]|nr:tetratricopeptide repeat protein [Planctomycetota bacterium]